jgi:16S rRNA (uracil1498-N3)-methyltransferase
MAASASEARATMGTPRFFVDLPLATLAVDGAPFALPPGAARHVQVLRLQPGEPLCVFDGHGGEWAATVAAMGRSQVDVQLGDHDAGADRELPIEVTLAIGMPANERMDALVEKATELGVAAIRPLLCERSVLRLAGERAEKKVAHWQAVAIAASEQSGRTRPPRIEPVTPLMAWLEGLAAGTAPPPVRWVLSLGTVIATDAATVLPPSAAVCCCLSGPEGGLAPNEEAAALGAGFTPLSLGPRVLRADTAPLALLAHLGLSQLRR